jgi:signal peptidase
MMAGRGRRLFRAICRRLGLLGFGLLMGIWLVAFRPQSVGGPVEYVIVRGTSMLPTYQDGDLVVVRGTDTYQPGDAVAYRVPVGDVAAGHIVVHRLVGGTAESGFRAQGDNNPSADPWTPRGPDIEGKVWLVIPGAGRVIAFFRQPVIVAAFGAAVVVTWVMLRVPAPRRDPLTKVL